MRVSEVVRRTGVTARALRYYESLGLVTPTRSANGYRSYSDLDVELVRQIQELTALGFRVRDTEPFLAPRPAASAIITPSCERPA